MIALDGVTVRAGRATLLDGVSMRVPPGCVTVIAGPNGAGKSTLLRTLCGDLRPDAGTVSLDGRPVARWPSATLARRRAVLPQSSNLAFPFTALEVVTLGRIPHASGRARDAEVARAALESVSLGSAAERLYPSLSGGERQRVHLARALAQLWDAAERGGGYLLLDEPTSSLDLAHQHHVLGVARVWAERGVGVLAVLHDLNLVAEYADRAAVLRGGRILAAGAPDEVLRAEVLEAAFSVPVMVTRHPARNGPLIVPVPPSRTAATGLTHP